ncbi:Glucan endo-1,3-beta-glucosidase 10 [Linum perenne]
MVSIHGALVQLGIDRNIEVSTPHSLAVLEQSYPPSAASFKPEVSAVMSQFLQFLNATRSPFWINAYTYFAYKDDPTGVSLDYVLFNPNPGMMDPTGWPSNGDADEVGATVQNAASYNRNLLRRQLANQGTPLRPRMRLEVYLFALFNENMKPGPTSERNYGLYQPDCTMVYNVGLSSHLGTTAATASPVSTSATGAVSPPHSFFFLSSSSIKVHSILR